MSDKFFGLRSAFLAITFGIPLVFSIAAPAWSEDGRQGLRLQLRISEAKRIAVARSYYKSVVRQHKIGTAGKPPISPPAVSPPKVQSPLDLRRVAPKPPVPFRPPRVR